MKNKKNIVIVILVLVTLTMSLAITKNNPKYTMQDGVLLAMSITDENGTRSITSFPERGAYNIEVDCGTTARGKWLAEDWKLGVEDITGNLKCNISFTTNPSTLKSKVESINTTNNNGYRYSGKQPDNWVWFNGEKWRIIGSIPTTLSDGTETNLVKIIRSESIGGLAFNDSTSSNQTWGNNTLYTLLNTKYYGKLDATGASPCLGYGTTSYALCNYETIGISNDSSDYYGKMVEDVYWNVGIISYGATVSSMSVNEFLTKSSVTGKIGLISASDYGYATSGITYNSVKFSSLSSYEQDNWLYGRDDEWTLSLYYNEQSVLYVDEEGNLPIEVDFDETQAYTIRPVVYLDPSVYIVSGDGTEGNPYQIAM